jgi:hypothetical protein
MNYLEVSVTISPGEGGSFDVKAASAQGGEGNSRLKLPFAVTDLSGLMFNRGSGNRNFDAVDPPRAAPQGTAVSYGEQLFEALFQGETLEVLSRTESAAKSMADTGVRIRISMNLAAEGMAEVASLPWELMRRRNQQALVVSVQTPVVRAFDTPKSITLQPVVGKLRILALIANPTGTTALNLAEEKARVSKIWATLDNVQVDFVSPVEEELLNHIENHQYHVVHYMGHGDFDSGAGGQLMLERADGSPRPVSGQDFAGWLADEPLRLVFLNACNTGKTGDHVGLHPFAGVASALIRNGVPAVVAMQFPISDAAAIIFAQTFYQRIAQGFPVDEAASAGRKRLLTSEGAEWATPVLYMRAPDGHLFDHMKTAVTPRKRKAAEAIAEMAPAMAPAPATVATEPAPAAPQPFVAGPVAAPKPWFKKPMILAGIGVALLAGIWVTFSNGEGSETTTTTATEAGVAAESEPAAAEAENPAVAAIAALPEDSWITDPDEEKTVNAVLATVTIDQLHQLANEGDAKAAYLYGNALWYGRGGVTTPSKASAWPYFEKAANQELAVAQYSMAYAYHVGVDAETADDGTTIPGLAMDAALSKTWLEKARAQGNASPL